MYIGKKYELVPRLIDTFINYRPRSNSAIVKIIQENGGWFEVKEAFFVDGFRVIKHIEAQMESIFTSMFVKMNFIVFVSIKNQLLKKMKSKTWFLA